MNCYFYQSFLLLNILHDQKHLIQNSKESFLVMRMMECFLKVSLLMTKLFVGFGCDGDRNIVLHLLMEIHIFYHELIAIQFSIIIVVTVTSVHQMWYCKEVLHQTYMRIPYQTRVSTDSYIHSQPVFNGQNLFQIQICMVCPIHSHLLI